MTWPHAALYWGTIVANLASCAFYVWRWRQARSACREFERMLAAPKKLTGIGVGAMPDGCAADVSASLTAHPTTTRAEIADAMRFGFAAAQQYLDGLAAERKVPSGE